MKLLYAHHFDQGTFCTWDAKPQIDFHQVHQVHGKCILNVSEIQNISTEADGITSQEHTLAIKTADCFPILVLGKKNNYALLHAGWRGVHQQIAIQNEIKKIEPVLFFLGPAIRQCCFAVSADFKTQFPNSSFFSNKNDQLYFDLTQELKSQIKNQFPQTEIVDCNICTCCNKAFHSYRRDKTTLRNWNLFIAKTTNHEFLKLE